MSISQACHEKPNRTNGISVEVRSVFLRSVITRICTTSNQYAVLFLEAEHTFASRPMLEIVE